MQSQNWWSEIDAETDAVLVENFIDRQMVIIIPKRSLQIGSSSWGVSSDPLEL